MIRAEGLNFSFVRNAFFWDTNLKDMTHADALVQPPVRGNCILWIAGHVLHYRGAIHRVLGLPEALPMSATQRFARDSAPVLGAEEGITSLETLIAAYHASQPAVVAAITDLSMEHAAEMVQEFGFNMPRAELLVSFMRHESYHMGQLELLRELALAARPSA